MVAEHMLEGSLVGEVEAVLISRAIESSDISMFSIIRCMCIHGGGNLFWFCDSAGNEVAEMAYADPVVKEAAEYLAARGYLEISRNKYGEHIFLLDKAKELEFYL